MQAIDGMVALLNSKDLIGWRSTNLRQHDRHVGNFSQTGVN
jgi:hypothetical protein